MQSVALSGEFFAGAVSIERTPDGFRPWRLPYQEADLFAEPLVARARIPAGVRVAFASTTRTVALQFAAGERAFAVDCVVEDELIGTVEVPAGSDLAYFEGLPSGWKRIELYLSQRVPVEVTGLFVDPEAGALPLEEGRPRWIAYGSSITQAHGAASPAQTWPAIVARRRGLHLTCLGFGGQCHLEPMVARVIRDSPADVISLCLGINVMGQRSLSRRTFQAAVIGMVKIIRERHAGIPLIVQSPIYCPHRETELNAVGLNLQLMRLDIEEAVAKLEALGDKHIYYLDGLHVLGPEYAHLLPDNLHPNADGYRVMAANFEREVLAMRVPVFTRGPADVVEAGGDETESR